MEVHTAGDWAAAERRATAAPGADEDDGDDLFGDFEDLEAGEHLDTHEGIDLSLECF